MLDMATGRTDEWYLLAVTRTPARLSGLLAAIGMSNSQRGIANFWVGGPSKRLRVPEACYWL